MAKIKSPIGLPNSPFMVMLLFFIVLLLVYASLYPFSGWRPTSLSIQDMLFAPAPKYWVFSEVLANLLVYIPLGLVGGWAIYPKIKGILTWLIVVLFGFLLSLCMESLQRFLPTRVPSNVDVLANTLGVILGATMAVTSAPSVLGSKTIRSLKKYGLGERSDSLLLLTIFWILAIIYPQSLWFVTGNIVTPVLAYMGYSAPIFAPPAGNYLLIWHFILMGLAFAVVCLLLTHHMPKWWVRLICVLFLACLAVSVQTASHWWFKKAIAYPIVLFWPYFLAILVLVSVLVFLPMHWQWLCAVLGIVAQLVLINLLAFFEFHVLVRETWLNFSHLVLGLAMGWPVVTLMVLLRRERYLR